MKRAKPPAFKATMRGPAVTMEIVADDIATGLADSFSMISSAVKRQAALASMYETHMRMCTHEVERDRTANPQVS